MDDDITACAQKWPLLYWNLFRDSTEVPPSQEDQATLQKLIQAKGDLSLSNQLISLVLYEHKRIKICCIIAKHMHFVWPAINQ